MKVILKTVEGSMAVYRVHLTSTGLYLPDSDQHFNNLSISAKKAVIKQILEKDTGNSISTLLIEARKLIKEG